MSETLTTPSLFASEADRRYWLLSKALEIVPLDRAIELARAAEAFITDTSHSPRGEPTRTSSFCPAQGPQGRQAEDSDTIIHSAAPQAPQYPKVERDDAALNSPALGSIPAVIAKTGSRSALPLSLEQREQVLSRMAEGVKNAVLALEFGLSARQVQGIRMGSAREIARRRQQLESEQVEAALEKSQHASSGQACIDEVVRYLRQQDDVVVPDEDGTFLVNARFRMPTTELVARANRIRLRQGKPEFKVAESAPLAHEKRDSTSTNGQPFSWAESRAQA